LEDERGLEGDGGNDGAVVEMMRGGMVRVQGMEGVKCLKDDES